MTSRISVRDNNLYPKLMISKNTNTIVLFENDGNGVVVYVDDNCDVHKLGEFNDEWIMSSFLPWNGTILLTEE